MATTVRVTRVANPRRKRRARRRMTPKQIKFFGTARQKSALRAARKRKASARRASNPRRRAARKHSTRRNPALVVTLGAVNPRRRHNMARRKKARRANPRRIRRSVARRRNTSRVVVMAPRHRRRRSVRRYRNPAAVFGTSPFSRGALTMIGGGLLGVAAAKFLPTLVPAGLTASTGFIGRTVVTGVSAWVASMLAGKLPGVGHQFADAVFFGGLMQTGSVALNALLPGFKIGGVPIGLNGMGELVSGQFSVPQNPLRSLPAAPAQARVQMNGLQRVYGTAL